MQKDALTLGAMAKNRIASLRRAKNLSQAELADAAGITQATVSRLERGEFRGRVANLEAVAKALGVPVTALFASLGPHPTLERLVSVVEQLSASDQAAIHALAETLLRQRGQR